MRDLVYLYDLSRWRIGPFLGVFMNNLGPLLIALLAFFTLAAAAGALLIGLAVAIVKLAYL